MKKLFNGRFLLILASSLVVLLLLTVGAFYLFDDEDDVFVKSGYVLNPLSSTTEKYFFNENVGYRENLSSMIEFTDVDANTVSILKDSFVHYLDESLSFLKDGAILDLDSLKGDKVVSFYNITNESIIEKNDSGYIIGSANGDIKLNNFVGRISDDKYIVVGDLNLKIAGNDKTIKGEYFEIVYVEEGIVNVENKNVKYQVTADDTFIYVGNDKVIDLGDKKITVNGKDLMSITSITIDGDENIEIVPKPNGTSGGSGTGGGSGSGGTGDGTGSGGGSGSGGTGDGTGSGGDNVDIENPDSVIISLKNVNIGSTNINVTFDVVNAKENDIYKLQVVNLNSGKTVDMVAEVLADVEIQVNLLTPSTKYLFMVINEKDNAKYFQKVLETTGFGIKLEKSYATDSSLAYKVTVEEGTDITNAKLSLYKFNEETMQNEIVTTSYVDSNTGEVKTVEKITYLSTLKDNLEGVHEVVYDGLDSNTIYTAVLDEFSVASSNFKDIYNITLTSLTLKQIPKFSEMTITKDVGAGSFDLSLGTVTDPDNAIVGYTYMIYNKIDDSMAIEPIVQTNASPISVKVGDGKNQLQNSTNYYYKVVIEYFDNEKYIEYITSDSIIFMMGDEPYITVVPNEELITHEQIGATIYLTDNSCLVSMPGREKCNDNSNTIVEVSRINPVTGEKNVVYTRLVTFDVSVEGMKYDLLVDNLQPGNTYNITFKSVFNNSDSLERQEILQTDESKRNITTKSLSSFNVNWSDYQSNATHVVNAGAQFVANDNSGTLTPEESANILDKVVIRLYEGRHIDDLEMMLPMATKILRKDDTFDLKDKIYSNPYKISTQDTFNLTMEALKNFNVDGKLSEYYTIQILAYTDNDYEIKLVNNVYSYRISSILLAEGISEPVLEITNITNKASGNLFENLINGGTYVGYRLMAAFDRSQLLVNNIIPQRIHFYVYSDGEEKKQVSFYTKDENGELKLVDKIVGILGENNYYETEIYMDYGTSYETVDEIMSRGNSYYLGYEVEALADDKLLMYPVVTDPDAPSDYGVYELVETEKETPSVKMYVASSNSDSITYAYTVRDPDNALYKSADSDKYDFYAVVNEGVEFAHDLVQTANEPYNKFEGRITISGLQSGDLYKLYYKKNVSKTGDITKDVVNYLETDGSGVRMFDGYYNAKLNVNKYNFKYQVINNSLKDNKVIIKILANEEMLRRIVSYKITFNDSKGNVLNKELWQLSVCDGDNVDAVPRCLSVDYTELRKAGMKSEKDETNIIKTTVVALYDNGLTGYDFNVGSSDDADYLYCIMQDNSSDLGPGNYIVLSSSGQQVTTWSDKLGSPKGYYTYTLNNSLLFLKSQLNSNHRINISVNLSSVGYSSSEGILNPKMISADVMSCSGGDANTCGEFSFNSITPKVSVSEKSTLINGNVLNFHLSGIDLNDVKQESDGLYYLYVETWENKGDVGDLSKVVRPVAKAKINSSNPTSVISHVIDGLKENTSYYYNVYAYMIKDKKYIYTQLFDASVTDGYEYKTYTFATAKASDIFHTVTVSYSTSNEIYGNRLLNTKINLLAYKNNIAFNFDIIYVLCHTEVNTTDDRTDNDKPCGLGEDEGYIFKKVISQNKVSTIIDDSYDISQYDLEYDKNYYMYVYASANYYDNPSDDGIVKRNIILNRYNINVKFKKLTEPSFVVTRNALKEGNDYLIDFNIVVNDPDQTLVDGKYYIKLLDQSGKNLVGEMQLQDADGTYYNVSNYHEYAFDAFVVSKNVRIRGLQPNTQYSFVVYSDAYLNNYVEGTLPGKENKTILVQKGYTVYSTNDYGVAFGTASYGVTASSFVVSFLGGSNFDNVVEVNYTIGLWDDDQSASTMSGTFAVGDYKDSDVEYEAVNKSFELTSASENWRFVIDPKGMKNVLEKTYQVVISFKVKVPGTEDKYVVLTHADVDSFKATVTYYEDNK